MKSTCVDEILLCKMKPCFAGRKKDLNLFKSFLEQKLIENRTKMEGNESSIENCYRAVQALGLLVSFS